MKLREMFTRENPNEIFTDNVARYADWLEAKLAHQLATEAKDTAAEAHNEHPFKLASNQTAQ